MVNLLEETNARLKEVGRSWEEVVFVGSDDGAYAISVPDFKALAASIDYDNGFGSAHIASDLVITFESGDFMSRAEYDGSEGWDYNRTPVRQDQTLPITRLESHYGGSLSDIHEEDN